MKSRRSRIIVFVSLLLLCLAIPVFLWMKYHIPPFRSLQVMPDTYFSLGMREVDLSLSFGRAPECHEEDDVSKTVGYIKEGGKCRYSAVFYKDYNGEFRASRICFEIDPYFAAPLYPARIKYEWPRNMWLDDFTVFRGESDFTDVLGEPSYVSISRDGTSKISNYESHNVAFMVRAGQVKMACISDSAIYFANEYGD